MKRRASTTKSLIVLLLSLALLFTGLPLIAAAEGVDPAQEPVAVEEPADPAEPTEPTEPTDPVDPVEPTEPTDPVDPADPADPVDPTEPGEEEAPPAEEETTPAEEEVEPEDEEEPAEEEVEAQDAPTQSDFALLDPRLHIETSTFNTGTSSVVTLEGTCSLNKGRVLENIKFRIESLDKEHLSFVKMDDNDLYTTEIDANGDMIITVKKLEGNGHGSYTTYGAFEVYWANEITPNGHGSDASGNDGLFRVTEIFWEGDAENDAASFDPWANPSEAQKKDLEKRVVAIANNQWAYTPFTKTFKDSGTDKIDRGELFEGVAANKEVHYVLAGKPNANVGAGPANDTIKQAYIIAKSAKFQVEITYEGGLIIPDFAAEGVNITIDDLFTVSAVADWKTEITTDGNKAIITFEYVGTAPMDALNSAVGFEIDFAGYWFAEALLRESGTATTGKVTIQEIGGEANKEKANTTADNDVNNAITGPDKHSWTVEISVKRTETEEFEHQVETFRKQVREWYYKPGGYTMDENGKSTELQRGVMSDVETATRKPNEVSERPLYLDDGTGTVKIIELDKVWFGFNVTDALVFPKVVESYTIEDKEFYYNDAPGTNVMEIIGYALPEVDTATTQVKVYVDGNLDTTAAVDGRVYLATPAQAIRFEFTKLGEDPTMDDDAISITKSPEILFQLIPEKAARANKDTIYNAATVDYKYFEDALSENIKNPGEPYRTTGQVPYTPNLPLPDGDKSGVNVDRTGRNGTINMPGDRIDYTLKVYMKSGSAEYVNGVDVLDVPVANLTFPENFTANVTIKRGTGGNLPASTVRPIDDIIVSDSGNSFVVKPTEATGPNGQKGRLYRFAGTLRKDDVITITYTAYISDPIENPDANGNSKAINELYARFWKNGVGGEGGTWEWTKVDDYEIPVSKPSIYGDTYIQLTDRDGKLFGANQVLVPDETGMLRVKGGVVNSPAKMTDPVFVVELAENLAIDTAAAEIVTNIKLNDMKVTGGRTISELKDLTVTPSYFDAAGKGCDAASARYVRLAFSGLELKSTKADGAYTANDLITFDINVKAITLDDKEAGNQKSAKSTVVLGTIAMKEHLYLNVLGQKTGNWDKASSNNPRLDEGDLTNFRKLFNTGDGGLGMLRDTTESKVYKLPKQIGITKTASTSAALHLGESVDFSIAIENQKLAGANTLPDADHSISVQHVVDLMVPGVILEDLSTLKLTHHQTGGGTKNYTFNLDFKANSKDDVKVQVVSRNLDHQRITISLNEACKLLPGEKLTVEYTAVVRNLSLLYSQVYSYTYPNKVSTYYNNTNVSAVAGTASSYSASEDDAVWGNPAKGDENTRLEAQADITVQGERINPGVQKTLVSPESPYTTTRPTEDAEWAVKVHNGAKAERIIDDFYIVDVLPTAHEYNSAKPAVLSFSPAATNKLVGWPATETAYNAAGQEVLYWHFTAEHFTQGGLQPGDEIGISLYTKFSSAAVGAMTNSAYIIPTGEDCYFTDANIEKDWGVYDSAAFGTTLYRLLEGVSNVPAEPAVGATAELRTYNVVGAEMRKTLTDPNGPDKDRQYTSSFTPYNLVHTLRGNVVTYGYEVKNTTEPAKKVVYENLILTDNLPRTGDSYVLLNPPGGNGRQSRWSPELFFSENGVTNSREKAKDIFTVELVTGGVTKVVTDAVDSVDFVDSANANAPVSFTLKLASHVKVEGQTTLRITWKMYVPEDIHYENAERPAYNSASFTFDSRGITDLKVEPEKVGLVLMSDPELSIRVEKLLQDPNGEIEEERFLFLLEKENPDKADDYHVYGLKENNVTLSEELISMEGSGDQYKGVFAMDVKTDVVKGGTLTGLKEGKYRITEIEVDSKYTVTYEPGQTLTVSNTSKTNGTIRVNNSTTEYPPPPPPTPPTTPSSPDTPTPPDDPAPPVTPAVPGGPVVPAGPAGDTLAPPIAPLGGLDAAGELVLDGEAPLARPGVGEHWSLLNLMCALFCGITSIIMMVMMLFRKLTRKSDEEEEAEVLENAQAEDIGETEDEQAQRQKGGYAWRVLSIVVALGAAIAFLLTEDIRKPMVFTCEWSPLMVTFAISQVLVMLGLRNTLRKPDEEEFDEEDLNPTGA